MDLALEPGCPDRRPHPRWGQRYPHPRVPVPPPRPPKKPQHFSIPCNARRRMGRAFRTCVVGSVAACVRHRHGRARPPRAAATAVAPRLLLVLLLL
eukprot:COSAG05_NODE_4094_length_1676_cov_6.380469_2_plen_96_part_00